MSLYQSVGKFIEKQRLFHKGELLLCAVSGGMDSMAMLDVLRSMEYSIHVCHVNYMLRGKESIMDQDLVESYARQYKIPFSIKILSPEEVKNLKDGNFQEKARDLRYEWFYAVMAELNATHLCLAHHQNDRAETFMLHAMRGSGISGLKSIQPIVGYIRRPLLGVTKDEIQQYVKTNAVPFRNDHTNFSDDYDRNYIRNQVLSVLNEKWPHAIQGIAESAQNISADYQLLGDLVDQESKIWIEQSEKQLKFGPISRFRNTPSAKNLAFHIFKHFMFNADTIQRIVFDDHLPGKLFTSSTTEAIIDRDYILLQPRDEDVQVSVKIESPGIAYSKNGTFIISKSETKSEFTNSLIQYIDESSVLWPLHIRNWEEGDTIAPLGMDGKHKKVSDILVDQKISIFDKRKQLVLCNGDGTIIWLIGIRLSELFKYQEQTNSYLKLEWQDDTIIN